VVYLTTFPKALSKRVLHTVLRSAYSFSFKSFFFNHPVVVYFFILFPSLLSFHFSFNHMFYTDAPMKHVTNAVTLLALTLTLLRGLFILLQKATVFNTLPF